jgi:hypothetical protein
MCRTMLYAAGLAVLWLGPIPTARAHEGPPFPIVMDRRAGPYVLSVWTDPDVGVEKGKFFVIVEPAPGTNLPEELDVEVCVRPTSGRLAEACYSGTRQNLRDRVQYYAEVEFDQQEMWQVRVRVKGEGGTGEVTAEVEATPPGYGAWDLLIYGFPFVLFGMLWLCVALRRRRAAREGNATAVPPAPLVSASAGPSENGVPTGVKSGTAEG